MSYLPKLSPATAAQEYSPAGLSAAQVKQRQTQFGLNKFTQEKLSATKIFLGELISPLNFILLAAATMAFFLRDFSDAAVITAIVLINSMLSFIQEYRSQKAVAALSKLIDRQILVVRHREQILIDESQLVPGDTVILRAGDVVPADIKIMTANNLSVSESQLTGESVPISKTSHAPQARETLLFAGSIIERGNCQGVVYATGEQTQLGEIAALSRKTKKITPYQKSLTEFSFSLLRIIAVTIVLTLVAKSFFIHSFSDLAETILFIVALAAAVVPEALPLITTITLSHGALELAKQKVIVKRLSALEDLGRINLLCTDKTGTLTQDKLTVAEVVTDNETLFQKLALASLTDLQVKNKKFVNSFDRAFADYVPAEIKSQADYWRQLVSLPFDPDARRRRAIVQDVQSQEFYLVVVGSAETLLNLAVDCDRKYYQQLIAQAGQQGLRQLAIAYKKIAYTPDLDILAQENNLTFLGFANLVDPLRHNAKATLEKAKSFGIEIKILTGDSIEVATYIGQELGLVQAGDKVFSGDELAKMTSLQLNQAVHHASIFARVTPEQKYNLIRELKLNNVVGYQGDGINDAPSLKLADVAIAVNNATNVAKDSADIVLLKDNLEVIVSGIHYGRTIFVNINKYIKHALVGNLGNFFSLAVFYVAFSHGLPMLPIQLLIGNLIQDMPILTIYADNVDEEEIRGPSATNQIKPMMKLSLILGLGSAIYYLAYFMWVGTATTALTRANLFLFFTFTQLLIVISLRTKHFLWRGKKPAPALFWSTVLVAILALVMVYFPPLANLMGFAPLAWPSFLILVFATFIYILILDLAKVLLYKKARVQ